MQTIEQICDEFDRLVERHDKLIGFLCLKASCGQRGYCLELQQECYETIIKSLPERMEVPTKQSETAWVYWRCRSAISHYRRSVRFRSMLPLGDREPAGGEATHEVTQLTVDELASCLHGAERRCFLLMADGASDDELQCELGVEHRTVVQMRHRIKKKLRQYLNQ